MLEIQQSILSHKFLYEKKKYLLEHALQADVALIKAEIADEFGNLIYKGTSRAFNPIMARAAKLTIVEVEKIIPSQEIDPERIGTPGIYVNRLVCKKTI